MSSHSSNMHESLLIPADTEAQDAQRLPVQPVQPVHPVHPVQPALPNRLRAGLFTFNGDPNVAIYPNKGYSVIFSLFLIGIAIEAMSSPLLPWCIWSFIRGSIPFLVLGVYYTCNGVRPAYGLFLTWFYIAVYIASFPLTVISLLRYNASLPYVCINTIIACFVDTLWGCYLYQTPVHGLAGAGAGLGVAAHEQYHIDSEEVTSIQMTPDTEEHCTICLDQYNVDETLTKLHCGHIYHTKCITPWLEAKGVCPVCRDTGSVRRPESEI